MPGSLEEIASRTAAESSTTFSGTNSSSNRMTVTRAHPFLPVTPPTLLQVQRQQLPFLHTTLRVYIHQTSSTLAVC